MSDVEHIPTEQSSVAEEISSLYDDYNLRLVNLGGGPVFLTPEGQGIFAGHLRMQKAQQLAGILGSLVQERAAQGPITEPITVADFDTLAMEGYDNPYIAGQAVWRMPSYIGIDSIDFYELEKHQLTGKQGERVEVSEVPLPTGGFMSTHLGYGICKVLLTPTSVLEQE